MAKKTYVEKLRDRRWQARRLRVLNRGGFRCECCRRDDRSLHVDHGYYVPGREPWEYELETLHCLCDKCHAELTKVRRQVHRALGFLHPRDLARVLNKLTPYQAELL